MSQTTKLFTKIGKKTIHKLWRLSSANSRKLWRFLNHLSYKSLLIILVVLLSFVVMFLKLTGQVSPAAAGWWNDTWHYRQVVSVGTSTAATNYPVRLSIGTSALIAASKMKSDCSDIRITVNGTPVPIFIETGCNSAATYVWARIPSISTPTTYVYLYYGNSQANSVSDIESTFNVVTAVNWEFNTNSNYQGWSPTNIGTTFATSGSIGGTSTSTDPMFVSATGLTIPSTTADWVFIKAKVTSGHAPDGLFFLTNLDSTWNETKHIQASLTSYNGDWQIVAINTGAFGAWANTITDLRIDPSGSNSSSIYIDWIRVLQSPSTAVSATTSGTEEIGKPPIAYWNFDEAYGATVYNQMEVDGKTGLTSWIKFDEGTGTTAFDELSNSNVIIGTGSSAPAWSTGVIGTGISLNGTTHKASFSSTSMLSEQAGTISLWVRPSSSQPSTSFYIFSIPDNGTNSRVYINTDATGTLLKGTLGSGTIIGSTAITANQWHHVALSWNGTKAAFYVDGLNTTSIDNFNGLTNVSGTYYLGTYNGTAQFYAGAIDNFKVYNRAISPAEVAAEYGSLHGAMINFGTIGAGATWPNGAQASSNQRPMGNSLNFNGTDDYVQIPTSSIVNQNVFSYSGWFKLSDANGGTIFGNHDSNCYYGYDLMVFDTGALSFRTYNNSGGYNDTVESATGLTITGIWYHYAVTADGSAIKLYLNGKLVAQDTSQTTLVYGTMSHFLGRRSTRASYENFFPGYLDETKFYNYALSADQVLIDYNRNAGTALGIGNKSGNPGSTNLVAWWKLDDATAQTAFDSSGNNNNGTLTPASTAPAWVPGMFGKALSFNGANNSVSIANEPNFDFERTNSFSISAWVKNNQSTVRQSIFSKQNSITAYAGYDLQIEPVSGRPRLTLINNQATALIDTIGAKSIADGQWHNIVATYNGTSAGSGVKMYVDGISIGISIAADSLGANSILNAIVPNIGSRNNAAYWNAGLIDNVKIFNKVLSSAEVGYESSIGKPPTYYSFDESGGSTIHDGAAANNDFGLISSWKFNENTGTTAYDETGNNNAVFGAGSSAPAWISAVIGTGLSFGGTTSYISIPNGINLTNSSFTISFWAKRSSISNVANDFVIGIGSSMSGNQSIHLGFRNTDVFVCGFYGNDLDTTTTYTDTTNWHHYSCTFDANSKKRTIYMDGILQATGYATNNFIGTNITANIGAPGWISASATGFFHGLVDNVRIYNRALPPEEVSAEANSTNGDLIGFGNIGSSAVWQDGARSNTNQKPLGRSLSFDGSNDHIQTTTKGYDQNIFSYSGWFKVNDLSASYTIFGNHDDNCRYGYDLMVIANGSLDFRTYGSGGGANDTVQSAANLITPGKWYHFTVTLDGSTINLYLNNSLVAQDTSQTTLVYSNQNHFFGRRSTFSSYENFLYGQLDEIKYFPYALSLSDIAVEYNRGVGIALGVGQNTNNAAQQVGTTSSLTGWWKFDDGKSNSSADSSGNNRTANLGTGGTTPTWTLGKFGKALNFNGTSNFVTANSSTGMTFSDFTISAWYNRAFTTGASQVIFANANWGGGGGIQLAVGNAGEVYCQTLNGVTGASTYSAQNIVTVGSGWKHLAISKIGSSCSVYVDGVSLGTTAASHATMTGSSLPFTFGRRVDAASDYVKGYIDNVKLFNRGLTADEISYEYNQNKPVPIAHWRLDEKIGTVAQDQSVNAYNVTMSSAMSSTTDWVGGKYNNGANFGGNNQCFTKTSGPYPHPDTITLTMWVKPAVLTTNYLFGYGNTFFGVYPYYIYQNSGKVRFTYGGTGGVNTDRYETDNIVLTANKWTHLTFTNTYGTPSAMKIYVDGQLVPGSWTQGDGTRAKYSDVNAYLTIGSLYNDDAYLPCYTTSAFNGILDEVKIYDRALTASQIQNDYTNGAAVRIAGPTP
jgi:hypothetical protein